MNVDISTTISKSGIINLSDSISVLRLEHPTFFTALVVRKPKSDVPSPKPPVTTWPKRPRVWHITIFSYCKSWCNASATWPPISFISTSKKASLYALATPKITSGNTRGLISLFLYLATNLYGTVVISITVNAE